MCKKKSAVCGQICREKASTVTCLPRLWQTLNTRDLILKVISCVVFSLDLERQILRAAGLNQACLGGLYYVRGTKLFVVKTRDQ